MIRIAKIRSVIYSDDGFHVFSGWCGEKIKLVYVGDSPPPALKTVEYKFVGEFKSHNEYGKYFDVQEWERVGKIKIHKKENPFRHLI